MSLSLEGVSNFIQTEITSTSTAQNRLLLLLSKHSINVGEKLSSDLKNESSLESASKRITVSTTENNIECRIALGKAKLGSKCIAPCSCTGSQRWIQFSEFNRLRRKDPNQWKVCQTCQQPFECNLFTKYGGLQASLVGNLLDNISSVRYGIAGVILIGSYVSALDKLLLRFFMTRYWWQMVTTHLIYLCRYYNSIYCVIVSSVVEINSFAISIKVLVIKVSCTIFFTTIFTVRKRFYCIIPC